MINWETMETPLGELLLAATDTGLSDLYFDQHRYGRRPGPDWERAASGTPAGRILAIARAELVAYFAGSLDRFTVPLGARGSEFQHRVWAELVAIPAGETITYGELARRIGTPRGTRAAAGAVARNPCSIIVPCHRVVGSDGSLTGFGGGLERKRWLLRHEEARTPALDLQLSL